MQSELLKGVTFLNPLNWSSAEFSQNVLQVARLLPSVTPQPHVNELEVESRRFSIVGDEKKCVADDIETTWLRIAETKEFPHLSQLALATLTMFHGNADVERTNSLIKNQDLTDKRNRLSITTLTVLIRIKMFLQVPIDSIGNINFISYQILNIILIHN